MTSGAPGEGRDQGLRHHRPNVGRVGLRTGRGEISAVRPGPLNHHSFRTGSNLPSYLHPLRNGLGAGRRGPSAVPRRA